MSSKHNVVAKLSAEVEYQSISLASSEVLWLQSLLCDLQVTNAYVPILLIDNINTKYLAANLVMHGQMKYVEIHFHFIRDLVVANKLDVRYTPAIDQVLISL